MRKKSFNITIYVKRFVEFSCLKKWQYMESNIVDDLFMLSILINIFKIWYFMYSFGKHDPIHFRKLQLYMYIYMCYYRRCREESFIILECQTLRFSYQNIKYSILAFSYFQISFVLQFSLRLHIFYRSKYKKKKYVTSHEIWPWQK